MSLVTQKMEKERENSYQKMKRSVKERHSQTRLHCLFSYIYSLLIEKDICDRQNISNKFVCAFPPEISSFFGKNFPFFFSFWCYPYFGSFLSTWSVHSGVYLGNIDQCRIYLEYHSTRSYNVKDLLFP